MQSRLVKIHLCGTAVLLQEATKSLGKNGPGLATKAIYAKHFLPNSLADLGECGSFGIGQPQLARQMRLQNRTFSLSAAKTHSAKQLSMDQASYVRPQAQLRVVFDAERPE